MGIFNFTKAKDINIDGFIISDSGELKEVPKGLEVYRIPSSVRFISSLAIFNNMASSAVEVDFSLASSISSLPLQAFARFTKLKKVILPSNLKKMDIYFNHRVGSGVELEIVLPNNLEQFAQNQFSPSLTRLVLDDTVTAVKVGIVSHNNILEELVIPGSLKNLGQYYVNQVRCLKGLYLKEGIISMHDDAIRGCNNLTEIHIPSSLRIFKLGSDDYRPVAALPNSNKAYEPTKEEIANQKARTIKLYKMFNGEEIIFEVKRNNFEKLEEHPTEFIFSGYGKTCRLSKSTIGDCKHFVVDTTTGTVTRKESASFAYIKPTLENPSILDAKTEEEKIKAIEKFFGTRISATKIVKNRTTQFFETIKKSKSELIKEKEGLLEDLNEDDDIISRLKPGEWNAYHSAIILIYHNLISKAPIEPIIIEPQIADEIDQDVRELMEKYGMSFEEVMKNLAEGNDFPPIVDNDYPERMGRYR